MKILLVLFSIVPCAYLYAAPIVCADAANHPCKRKCIEGKPMRCCYEMTIEWMFSNEPNCLNCFNGTYSDCFNSQCMPIDENSRLITVYNRTFPGPSIEVCLGDEVFVNITNDLFDVTTTVHWHGMHQRNSQYMDGVPHITQCPIGPFSTFEYRFFARQVGTHFYHSHSSIQKANGAFGHLVVRPPDSQNEILRRIPYDFDLSEHTISVTDWYNDFPLFYYFAYIRRREIQTNEISTLVVNGFGPQPEDNNVPPRRFFVTKGKKYRFRLIHAGAAVCPIEVSIDNHKLIIVATDGEDIEPVVVDSFYFGNGERFDFILDANQQVAAYTMRFTGYLNCNKSTIAALIYEESSTTEVTFENRNLNPNRLSVNCFNSPTNRSNCISYTALRSLMPMEYILSTSNPNYIFPYYIYFGIEPFIAADQHGIGEENLATPHLNLIKMTFPPTPLLVKPSNQYCNQEEKTPCNQSELICTCVHHVNLPWKYVIELILVDERGIVEEVHPIHLHGYSFRVIAQDRIGNSTTVQQVKNLNLNGGIKRNFDRPILKDTVSVPSGGYTVIRFYADNPGMWLLHCHVDFHMEEGMQMVFQVGNRVWYSWPKPPPNFFKDNRCGNYTS